MSDQRQYRSALDFLEQALPHSTPKARTLCEIGRAYYMLDEEQKGRQFMEEALTLNPCYDLGWQYLLVLLDRTKSPEGPVWAQRRTTPTPQTMPSPYSA